MSPVINDGGAISTPGPAVSAAPDREPQPFTTVVLIRHARSTANAAGVLAGRAAGVRLDDVGLAQALRLRVRLDGVPVQRLVSSPLTRCRQTLEPVAAALGLPIEEDDRLVEVDYGAWTGRTLRDLASEPLWRVVQQHPAAAAFPGGESLAAVSARAVSAVRDLVADPAWAGAPGRTAVVCSHGDVIKAVLADALGMHLDGFQRIVVAPAALSVVRYTPHRPFVERINDTGDLDNLRPAPTGAGTETTQGPGPLPHASDAVPGGVTR